jgi:hypothetical protein
VEEKYLFDKQIIDLVIFVCEEILRQGLRGVLTFATKYGPKGGDNILAATAAQVVTMLLCLSVHPSLGTYETIFHASNMIQACFQDASRILQVCFK